MQVAIEKVPKQYTAEGTKRYEVSVSFPNDFKRSIFERFDVEEKYELQDILGAGTYGLVCSANDTSNGKKVAIKKIQNIFRWRGLAQRAIREVLIHGQINHPFIVAFNEIMRPVDRNTFNDLYIVMETVEEDLGQSIIRRSDTNRGHQIAPLNVKLVMNQLLRAVQYLHAADVLHRDLKPNNILLTKMQTVKLCDFGCARTIAPQMTEKIVMHSYRPPELYLKDMSNQSNYGPAIDIWSLGCIFADMLLQRKRSLGFGKNNNDLVNLRKITETIRRPDDDDLSEMIDNEETRVFVKNQLPPNPSRPLSAICRDVADKSAVNLLKRMLAFNPRKRVSIADALQHEYMAEITVDVLARELNLEPADVEKLKAVNPPRIEMNSQNLYWKNKKNLRKIVLDSCVNSKRRAR